jgi:hypothetical protein
MFKLSEKNSIEKRRCKSQMWFSKAFERERVFFFLGGGGGGGGGQLYHSVSLVFASFVTSIYLRLYMVVIG